jgi:diguanylate cyclase (GGDEF)-like protein
VSTTQKPNRSGWSWPIFWTVIVCGFGFVVLKLRLLTFVADPLLDRYLEMAGSLVAFTFAANALVRFRGAHDRISLILAFGFVLSGLIEAGSSLTQSNFLFAPPGTPLTVPLSWMVGRTLLALLLVAALVVERHVPVSRDPTREIMAATLVVGVVAYLTSAAYFAVPVEAAVHVGAWLPRPLDLVPAAIFAVAAIGYWYRLANVDSALDRALCAAAVMNVACHLMISQSQHLYDAPFIYGHFLKVASYVVVLGGALLDNGRLFDQVSELAKSDPLTGLANYRRLLEVMDNELDRARRSQRPFAVILLDLDGLKQINDRHGHLIGSKAIKRLGQVLRVHCRSTDTAARYGGDEFALVLPEASEEAASSVANRICERLAADQQGPAISVSVGVALYPRDGVSIEKLLGAADRALYAMKARGHKKLSFSKVAACL